MSGLEDRQSIAQDIDEAFRAGARLFMACDVAGIGVRTLQRWQASEGLVAGDLRPAAVQPIPAHALDACERAKVLEVANEACFADVPPTRIVPILADEGVYVASESTFSRALRAAGMAAIVAVLVWRAKRARLPPTWQRRHARSGAGI